MKVSELMVGDLCLVNRDNLCIKKGTIVRISCIDADNRLKEKGLIGCTHCYPLDKDQDNGGIWCEYLDPIPLTPEILEKNGWKHDFDEVYVWKDGAAHYISIDLDGKTRIYVANLYIFGMALGYVHELQHALRLCGIEKEIEL